MDRQERERIDRITAVVHYLLKGERPDAIPCENDPDDEIRQLSEKVNELNRNFSEIRDFIEMLARGNLDIHLPKENVLASPFKHLHAALSHLTWQTRQIARGDLSQRVDFMGDFSQSFNSMVESLNEARSQLLSEIGRYKTLAELKEHYLNVMAHDIRTPVGSVMGFADILLEGELDEDQRRHVRTIRRNSESLIALIDNILDMARLEKRKMELASVPFSLRTMGKDIAAMIEPKLGDAVRFVFRAEEGVPSLLKGDPHRLRQVLVNLVGNAAKFTEKGRISLKAGVGKEESGDVVLSFSVDDTGVGIPRDSLESIFQPFSQADGSIASRFGGTGLGLAISRELVSLMGGELEVESEPGRGTSFRFSVKFESVPQASDPEPPPSKIIPSSRKCKILVVDDDPQALEIIENILEKQDVRFTLCQKSAEAYERLEAAYEMNDPFTLAWLDIDMPSPNGFELAAKIRTDRRFKHLRLVACTAHTESIGDSVPSSNFGFVAAKPLTSRALERILEEARSGYSGTGWEYDLSGTNVLVADDNALNRFLVVNILKKLDIEVSEAENGLEAIEMVAKQSFDAVLMDKKMPVTDGIEAIRQLRETYDKKNLPILGFTADSGEADRDAFLAAGANDIVAKPIIYEDIVEKLRQAVKLKRDA